MLPGEWRPDPAGDLADGRRRGSGSCDPLRAALADRVPLAGPPALDSAQYAAEFAEVRDYGGAELAACAPRSRPPRRCSTPSPPASSTSTRSATRSPAATSTSSTPPTPWPVRRQPRRRRHRLLAGQVRPQVLAPRDRDRPRRHRRQPGHRRRSRLDAAAHHTALSRLRQRPRLLRRVGLRIARQPLRRRTARRPTTR